LIEVILVLMLVTVMKMPTDEMKEMATINENDDDDMIVIETVVLRQINGMDNIDENMKVGMRRVMDKW